MSVVLAAGCQPVSDGPKPTLFMPAVEKYDLLEDFDEPLKLTILVDRIALRRPSIRETVEGQIRAMTAYVRRRGRGLREASSGSGGDEDTNNPLESATHLAATAAQLHAYLPMDAGADALAQACVSALANSLGKDAELHQGDLFASQGGADIAAGMHDRIAMLRLRHLDDEIRDRMQTVLMQWSSAAETPRAILIDLSECNGGSPTTAISLVNALAPGRAAFQLVYRNPKTQTVEHRSWRSDKGFGSTSLSTTPLFVVTSRGTDGIAEAVAQALRAHRAAHIIGYSTSGSGRITSWHHLPWNAWFGFTVADIMAPDGTPLRDKPLIPDACPTADGLAPLAERTPENYRAICVEARMPVFEDLVEYVESRLAAAGTTPS